MSNLIRRIPPALLALLLVAITHLIYILTQWHNMPLHDGLPVGSTDTDPWLRLTLVREWLTTGDWYNHHVVNSDAPYGATISPWTRPLDLVIAALIKLQPASIDLNLRLMHAALLLPWLWMMLLLTGIYRILKYFSPIANVYFMATTLVATMPILWNYFGLGNADHHAPLAVLFIWALGGVLHPNPSRRLLIASGIFLGIQLWVSVEAIILIALIYSWCGLNWLRGEPQASRQLLTLTTSAALTSLAALLIEHPTTAWLTPIYDTISIVYVVLLALLALLVLFLHLAPAKTITTRLVLSAIAGGVAAFTFYRLYPLALHGPMAEAHPFVFSDILPRISEAKALYESTTLRIIANSLQPLLAIALCAATWLCPKYSFFTRRQAEALGYFALALFALYFSQQRWGYYCYPILPLVLAPVLAALFEPEHSSVRHRWPANLLAGRSDNAQVARRIPIFLAILALPIALMFLDAELQKNTADQNQGASRDNCYTAARQLIRSGELTRVLGDKPITLLLPTDLGTEILFFTPYRIVASNYHREGAGIQYAWEANRITEASKLRAHLRQRHIDAVLLCPTVEPTENSILESIATGSPLPSWLKRVTYQRPPQLESAARDATLPTIALVKTY